MFLSFNSLFIAGLMLIVVPILPCMGFSVESLVDNLNIDPVFYVIVNLSTISNAEAN